MHAYEHCKKWSTLEDLQKGVSLAATTAVQQLATKLISKANFITFLIIVTKYNNNYCITDFVTITGLDYLSFWTGDGYCLLPTFTDAEVISLVAGISKLKGDDDHVL